MRPEHAPPHRALAAGLVAAALLLAAAGGAQRLVLDGRLEATAGGLRFGDGTLQTTAASGTADYAGILVVDARGGGDFTTIQGAIDAVGTTLPAASAANRYLVRVAPGTYSEQVTMEEWVDLEGAGEGATTVTWTGSDIAGNAHTLEAANNAELRHLRVVNTGGADWARGVIAVGGDSTLSIHGVTAEASGATDFAIGFYLANGSGAVLRRVTARATGVTLGGAYGIEIDQDSPTLVDVEALASGGTQNRAIRAILSSGVTIRGGVARAADTSGSQSAVELLDASATISELTMAATGGSNATAFRSGGAPSAPTRILGSRIEASGASFNFGVFNNSSEPVRVHGSAIAALPGDALDAFAGSTIEVASSLVDGTIGGAGTHLCVASFNGAFGKIAANCL